MVTLSPLISQISTIPRLSFPHHKPDQIQTKSKSSHCCVFPKVQHPTILNLSRESKDGVIQEMPMLKQTILPFLKEPSSVPCWKAQMLHFKKEGEPWESMTEISLRILHQCTHSRAETQSDVCDSRTSRIPTAHMLLWEVTLGNFQLCTS